MGRGHVPVYEFPAGGETLSTNVDSVCIIRLFNTITAMLRPSSIARKIIRVRTARLLSKSFYHPLSVRRCAYGHH